ncbi:hypothetical protein IGI65_001951 [Enterococcus sp. DIV0755b]|uniref:YxeA family protein n=1 Tax=Enterococcus sp. DIV0755b TaxID=2774657 RepID=UPI003F204757
MKKIIFNAFLALLLIGGAWLIYEKNFATTDYYTKIVTEGNRTFIGKSNNGKKQYRYTYNLPSFTKDNQESDLSFDSNADRPLKRNAYLILHFNKQKGVVGWEEVKAEEVPSSVLKELDK